jgi:putative hydrolase of the HAD superfamily
MDISLKDTNMAQITTLFWDVGGVLLTNGWDTSSRQEAAREFNLDWDQFQGRHEMIVTEFEKGRIDLEEYLECTVFHAPRSFSREDFREFMFARSRPKEEILGIVRELASSGRYLMATLNNESRPLNLYRIREFGLDRWFSAFFSSCFLGTKKPEEAHYRAALEITQREPQECLYVDDRELNVEMATRMGIPAIHFQNAEQLQREFSQREIWPCHAD